MPEHTKAGNELQEDVGKIYEADMNDWLDFALAHKNEPEKVAEKVKATEKQRNGRELPAFVQSSLIRLAQRISHKADLLDSKAESIDPTPPRKEGIYLPLPGPRHQEGSELRKEAQELRKLAQG